ncbi:MAG: hypothetical protein OQK77_12290, partial [Psychromonas sp.]|nr:hypothetical protein [Psychromonas sp.]
MKNLLIVVFTVSFLSACATSKLATEQIENAAIKQAAEANISSKQAVKDARNALLKANSDELFYYTPLHFKDAQESLEKLEALQKERTPVNDTELDLEIITESFKTQQFIDSAYQSKAIIESTLSESLSLKSELDEMNCKKEFPEAYSEMNEELIDLFKLIEQNKAEKARSRETDLLADMGDLEMKTLINIYVKPAVFILEKAEDFDADDYAEKTFEQAELSIKRAEAFIKVNYRKRNAVKQIGLEALIAAKKALNIGELSHSMVDLDEGDAEAKALEIDALFETVIDGFAAQDLRGLTLKEQAQALAELARVKNSR